MIEDEFDLIAKFIERLPSPGPEVLVASGDDAAVTDHVGPVVVSVDAIVEGVHFERPAFSPLDIGRKALAAAISDLAAMAATPRHGYVVVGIPKDEREEDLLLLADGLASVAASQDMAIIGGDIVRAPGLMISVTAIGSETDGVPLIARSGAQPGDVVVVTGEVGGAAAGLALLSRDHRGEDGDELIARQLDPTPRVAEGQALARAGATAMIDLSDGLIADAGRIANASGVRIEIDADLVPFQRGACEALSPDLASGRIGAASGGEDYELLACIPADRVDLARDALDSTCGITEIGTVLEGDGAFLLDESGEILPAAGFDHFSSDHA